MHRTMPRVEGGRLYQAEREGDPIVVGTPAWYDWLEHHSSFLFVDLGGGFTARKRGTDPNNLDWEASRARAGRLWHVSLGPARTLTLSRLQAAAWTLTDEGPPTEPTELPQAAASMLPTPTVGLLRPLLRTKLSRPRITSDLIPRVRLIERLNAGLSSKVTLLSAPTGFGKTTLLVEWLQTTDQPTAWLTLQESDNEISVFVHALTAALHTVLPDACPAMDSLLQAPQFPPPERVALLLLNDLAALPQDVILVLDEYHTIHGREVHRLLDLLIRHLPPQVHLVLATRADPPLPLAAWRAQGQLNELRGADLRFTLEETQAFLARILGDELAREAAETLEEWTEGWIAVLRLAALSLRGAADRAAFLERLRSIPDDYMSRRLVEDILDQQAPAVQELLVRTSLLERFCAEMCAAILGSGITAEHVQASLEWLERMNVFLVSLDEHHGWYRFHHLFKPLLQQHLQARVSQEEVAMLHRRASVWYAAQGLIEQAIEQALAAGDTTEAAQLVEAQFPGAFEQEQWGQMERWLHLLPEEQIQGSAGLLLTKVWILQARGQLNDLPRLLTTAEQLLATSDSGASDLDDPQSRLLRALIAIAWSHIQFFTGQAQASLESARSALEWIPPGEAYVASFALFYLALSNQITGQEDVALVELQQALRDQSTHLNSTARLLFAQALVYLATGKLHQVEHTARHLLQITQEADLAMSHSWAHWLLGIVHYEWNNLDTAVYHFSVVIANQHHAHFWAVQEAMYGLALTYQAQGLGTQAQETARALLELVQEEHNMRDLLTAYAFCGQLALLQDEVESAEQWLELAGDQEVLVGPMTSSEVPAITKARLLLAKGDEPSVARGQALLDELLQHAQAMHNRHKTIQLLALQALAYDLQGRMTEALAVLERALALGRPGGFIRTVADLPPLATLLQEVHKHRKTSKTVDNQLDAYLQRLLVVMRPMAAHAVSQEELMRQEGLEPLTERELQILRLLDKDLTNKEIARELVVTPGTVKVHTNSIYRKLRVKNRRAAVTLSKALGLLTADQTSTRVSAK